ncbi:MAG: xanthine dehydrogenase family protein subunit M [Burkholderiaceae bacterium]|nr:xanthine dehydrogenase family protein subunit M [Burkholderiaceae bacterium]
MYNFTFERPASLADASQRAKSGGQPLAGGQTLLAAMKQRLLAPDSLIDLAAIASLAGVSKEGNAIVIGAMTRHRDVEHNDLVRSAIPALAGLAGGIGDRQVRARGTLGGSVANTDPAACYPSAVLGLGATILTTDRKIAADDFFQGMYATALEPGELITAISFPIPQRAAYVKFRQPASRFAIVGVFLAQTASGVRVAITGASAGVFRHTGLEAALNQSFTPAAVDGVAIDASSLNTDLHGTAAYRAQLIRVLTRQAVQKALG